MIWLYRLCYLPAFLLLLPAYLRRMWRRGGYARDFVHRFGYVRGIPPRRSGVRRMWLQAVSVGELRAAEALLQQFAQDPHTEVVLSTTTSTGYALAREKLAPLCAAVCLFPLDFWPFSARAWRRINPDLIAMMDSELWPEHLHRARRRAVPAVLVNARMSDRTHARYSRFARPVRWLMGHLHLVLAMSDLDAARYVALGVPRRRIRVTGNLKCDIPPPPRLTPAHRAALRAELGFAADSLVILGSSTWSGEESALADALRHLRETLALDARLLLVPRHAERREELTRALPAAHLRTQAKQARPGTEIYVADTTGELARLAQVADVAFIGKSLPPHGEGQSPLEAAALGLPLLVGPSMSNFRQIRAELLKARAARAVADPTELRTALEHLLVHGDARRQLGQNASAWAKRNRGALPRTIDAFERLFERMPRP